MSLKQNLPIVLKKIRRYKDLNQEDVAVKIPITQGQLIAYELGKTTPSLEIIEKICEALEIKPIYFFKLLCAKETSLNKLILEIFEEQETAS